MSNKIEWELINNGDGETYRAEVIGGWLIRYHSRDTVDSHQVMVFVPDPHHAWKRKEAINHED